jgi:phytoene dehydrogenase-like protein
MIGTPLTHERFLTRPEGSYGPTFKSTLDGPLTPLPGLYLAGDSTFPGIGVPAVALSGAQAANTLMPLSAHLGMLMRCWLANKNKGTSPNRA